MALLGAVHGQAYYGSVEAELAACSGDNFVDLGCFADFGPAAGDYFTFQPQGGIHDPPSATFPGFDPGSPVNNTLTPLDCARACRGFGYKFAAVVNVGECRCGIQLPDGLTAGTGHCDMPCPGDANQFCGGWDGSSASMWQPSKFQ
jgi:hypothetical protein